MKKIFFLILISCFLVSNNSNKEELTFEILNKEIKLKDSLNLRITNNSNQNYFIPINFEIYDYLPHLEDYGLSNFYFNYKIVSNKDNEIDYFNVTRKSGCFDSIYEVKMNKAYFKEKPVLKIKAKSYIDIKIPFSDSLKLKKCENYRILKLDNKNNYSFQLEYNGFVNSTKFVDSNLCKKMLKINYLPYKNKIVSNKTPIILK